MFGRNGIGRVMKYDWVQWELAVIGMGEMGMSVVGFERNGELGRKGMGEMGFGRNRNGRNGSWAE